MRLSFAPDGAATARTVRWWPVALAVVLVAVYGRGLWIPYFADDFQFIFGPSHPRMIDLILQKNPSNRFYRPLEAITLAAIQAHWGVSTLPVHLLALVLHGALCGLVFVTIRREGFGDRAAALGCLVMAVSQANVLAVASVDTLSQIGATLLGCTTLWLLAASGSPSSGPERDVPGSPTDRGDTLAVVLFVISLFCKETAVSMLPFVLLILALQARGRRNGGRSWLPLTLRTVPYFVAFACYMTLRRVVIGSAPAWGSGRYDLSLGANVIRNVGAMTAAALVPVSSVDLIQALRAGATARAGIVIVASVILVMMVAWGASRSPRRVWLVGVAIGFVSALFPMAALNHVSELYVYNAMPFVTVLIGVGLDSVLRERRTMLGRALVAALTGLLVINHIGAVQSKTTLMLRNGERASNLVAELKPWVEQLPIGGRLVLVNAPAVEPDYSVYVMHGLNVLMEGEHGIALLLDRPDIGIRILSAEEASLEPSDAVFLTLKDGRLGLFSRQQSDR